MISMKSLLVALALVVSFAQTTFASELSFVADLKPVQIDPDQNLGNIIYGDIRVDQAEKSVTLRLQPAMTPCPAGLFCAQVMPQAIEVTLPLVSVEKSSCGDTYIASRDHRPVDGMLTEIKVVDYSKALCHVQLVNAVTVDYTHQFFDRINFREVTLRSVFGGEKLN
jgi:hypothetical protein